jgi:aldose sugar dehydrogenase
LLINSILTSVAVLLLIASDCYVFLAYGQPSIQDNTGLMIDLVASGLKYPTGLAFLGPDDLIVIEKNEGIVKRIVNGQTLEKPLADVGVANQVERGLLGVAVLNTQNKTFVYLYYTQAETDGGEAAGNRLYRYELVNDELKNPELMLDLPVEPGPAHNGGVIALGPDNNVYVVVGNLFSNALNEGSESSIVQNVRDGRPPDGRGGILRITQDGQPLDGILGNEHPLNLYYAYGIRNSFGIAFDPITGKLWDTENGGRDEINLIEPGFNSGWKQVSGMSSLDPEFDPDVDLIDFDGRGVYSDPELDLGLHTAPTAITFLHSDKLGSQYENDMFVGNTDGKIFNFNLNKNRTQLDLDDPLDDKTAENQEDLEDVIASGFSVITDLEVGPDGYLYVVEYDNEGKIYRIMPKNNTTIE